MSVTLAVRVQPGAKRAAVVGRLADGTVKLAVTAPPEAGRANAAVIALLADVLGVKARQVAVKRGASSRAKVIEVVGVDGPEVQRRIDAALADAGGTHGD